MKVYDISVPITEKTVTWPGDPDISIKKSSSIMNGDNANVSIINMGAHTGTHIDSPYHFIESGKTIDLIPLDILVGPCLVIDVMTDDLIRKEDIDSFNLEGVSRVLFKTNNSKLWKENTNTFNKNFIGLSLEGAQYLIDKKVKLIGIDYLSIESFHGEKGNPVHKLILMNNVVIIEGLNLSGISHGPYELICLPLKFEGIEGSPARAILKDNR